MASDGSFVVGDGVPIAELARTYGTPFFVYDVAAIRRRIAAVRDAFGGNVKILYAMKANPNAELLRSIRDDVSGLDVSSLGEIQQAISAGYDPATFSFAGPGKTEHELTEAAALGTGMFSIESSREIRLLAHVASQLGRRLRVMIRINPLTVAAAFSIRMGGRPTQFGVDEEVMDECLDLLVTHSDRLDVRGVHVYAGTQSFDARGIADGIADTLRIAGAIEARGLPCAEINLGGGFGVSFDKRDVRFDLAALAAAALPMIAGRATRFAFELGRYLVSDAGIYVARVIGDKTSRGERFVILDGGMNHHLAASGNLGQFRRRNYVVSNLSRPDAETVVCNLVGPLCTPIDLMGHAAELAAPASGDLIGFFCSGAYGYTASPLLFLGHTTPAEVIVEGNTHRLGRRRFDPTEFTAT